MPQAVHQCECPSIHCPCSLAILANADKKLDQLCAGGGAALRWVMLQCKNLLVACRQRQSDPEQTEETS